jgi:hypothetical protein
MRKPRPEGPGRGVAGGCSVAVRAAAARPDQIVRVVIAAEQVGEDGGGEARVVELDREVVTALIGALGPGGPDLGVMRCAA